MGQIVAINKRKTAKTTTCPSLGACLAEMGQRSLAVDLDAQPHLTPTAGLDPNRLEWRAVDLLSYQDGVAATDGGQAAMDGAIRPTSVGELDILPAGRCLASAQRFLYRQAGHQTMLPRLLATWQAEYDDLLLDCPSSLGAITLMALTTARRVLIPVQCEYYAKERAG